MVDLLEARGRRRALPSSGWQASARRAPRYPEALRPCRYRLRRRESDARSFVRHQMPPLPGHRPLRTRARACGEEPRQRALPGRARPRRLRRGPDQAVAARRCRWCSLSIHHLPTEQKKRLFETIRAAAPLFMIYEPTLQPDESRNEYLERFRRVNRPAWSFLTSEEW